MPGRYHHRVGASSQVWLGLDVGTRRIGIALSNILGIAQPLMTLERTQPRRDQRSILRLARRHGCAGIVVGNPVLLSGAHSRQTERVHRFVADMEALMQGALPTETAAPEPPAAPLPIYLWDERLSTSEAHAALDATSPNATNHDRRYRRDNRRDIRRDIIDQIAAVIILQGWLDAQSGAVTLLPPDSAPDPAPDP